MHAIARLDHAYLLWHIVWLEVLLKSCFLLKDRMTKTLVKAENGASVGGINYTLGSFVSKYKLGDSITAVVYTSVM